MGWSSDFKAALYASEYEPRYLLEWVKVPAGTLRVFGSNLRLSSAYDSLGYRPHIRRGGSSFQGPRVTPRDWNCQPGSFDIGVDAAADPDIRKYMQRGQAVTLKVGLQRNGVWHYEPVLLATVVNMRYGRSGWILQCRGLEGSLHSRLTYTAGESLLCHDLAATAVNDAAGYAGGATLTVDSTVGFRTDGQGTGVVKVTPAAGGTAYYVTYTGTTATTFTGCTAGKFGTAFATTADNSVVSEVAYTKGHPCEVVRRVLCSTGTAAANGAADILPASWGYGIDDALVDARDMLDYIAYTQPAAGVDDWHWLVDAEVDDGNAHLATWLNSGGYFLTQYQGLITCRAAVEPWAPGISGAHEIEDSDIAEIVSYSQWGGDAATTSEYQQARITLGDGTNATSTVVAEVDHHPARGIMDHVLEGLFADSTNFAAIQAEHGSRLKQWDIRTPEYITVRCHGWRHGKMAAGDVCKLTTDKLISRDGNTFARRACLVLSSSPAWFGSDTIVELAILPADESVPWRPV